MSFNRTLANQRMLSDHVLQIVKALEGDANLGQPIKLTALSDAANFALDVRNLSSGGALRVRNVAGTVLLQVDETGLTLGPAVTRLVPGGTSFAVRDAANANDNFIITNAGAITVRSTIGGVTTLTATTLAGTLSTAAQAGVTSLGTLTALTVSGTVTMTAAASKLVPGATSFSHRNTADSLDNFLLTDAGAGTIRAGLTSSAGGVRSNQATSDDTAYTLFDTSVAGGGTTATSGLLAYTTTAITTAKTIAPIDASGGTFFLVSGSDGIGNEFFDLVSSGRASAPAVVSTLTSNGAPQVRTYTRSGANLQLAMAANTYTTRVTALTQSRRT